MIGRRRRLSATPSGAALALLLFLLSIVIGSAQGSPLTGGPLLATAYDAIVDARFDDVPALLASACPPDGASRTASRSAPHAPPEACQLLEAVAIWWRIQLDSNNRSHDEEFRMRADAAIAAIDQWTMREPMRAEAWFYLGGAYGARAQWRVLRGERLSAARDGKRIKDALERALAIDPQLQDAYFGIGLYHYYADVAPAAAKFLRWLLLLPGGDRVKGLEEMLRAREGGELLESEADYQLHLIYLWYEKRTDRALALLRGLRTRHPHNPHFLRAIAEIEDTYLHDTDASLRSWQQLLDAARAGRVAESSMAETTAQLGIARALDARRDSSGAVSRLREVIERKARGARRCAGPRAAAARTVARSSWTTHRGDGGVSCRTRSRSVRRSRSHCAGCARGATRTLKLKTQKSKLQNRVRHASTRSPFLFFEF